MVSVEYGYDYPSNRTFAYDARFQSGRPMNHAYTNDPLNRLTAAKRNTRANLTGGTTTNGPENTIGWDGCVFNAATGDYLVRHRTYRPPLGRWGERDPLMYLSGLNTYEDPEWDPLGHREWSGLRPVAPGEVDPHEGGVRECSPSTSRVFRRANPVRIQGDWGYEWSEIGNAEGFRRACGFYPDLHLHRNRKPNLFDGVPGQWYDENRAGLLEAPDPRQNGRRLPHWRRIHELDMFDAWAALFTCSETLGDTQVECARATDSDRLACLRAVTAPGTAGTYGILGANCRDRVDAAPAACCLRREGRIHETRGVQRLAGGSS